MARSVNRLGHSLQAGHADVIIQIVTDPCKDDVEVGVRVTIHVGLDNGISPALEPSDAVGDDARMLGSTCEGA
jgi:hypothetical protein